MRHIVSGLLPNTFPHIEAAGVSPRGSVCIEPDQVLYKAPGLGTLARKKSPDTNPSVERL